MSALTWSLDVDLPTWMVVPSEPFHSAQWRSDVHGLFRLLEKVDQTMPAELRPLSVRSDFDIDGAIDSLLEFASSLPVGHRLVAGLSVAHRWPLPVILRVNSTGDAPDDLLEAAGARGGLPVEAPIVDYLPDEVGDGIRVTRFDLDDAGDLWASVSCARRVDGLDTIATWRTVDLAVIPLFQPLLVDLLGAVRITEVAA